MAAYQQKIDAVNYIVGLYGGTGSYQITLDGLNRIVVLQGSSGGFDFDLEALNEWVRLLGGVGNFNQDLAAYNEISRLVGGRSNFNQSIDALNEIALFAGADALAPHAVVLTWTTNSSDNTPSFDVALPGGASPGAAVAGDSLTIRVEGVIVDTYSLLAGDIVATTVSRTLGALGDGVYSVTGRLTRGAHVGPLSVPVQITISTTIPVALMADFSNPNQNEAWVFW